MLPKLSDTEKEAIEDIRGMNLVECCECSGYLVGKMQDILLRLYPPDYDEPITRERVLAFPGWEACGDILRYRTDPHLDCRLWMRPCEAPSLWIACLDWTWMHSVTKPGKMGELRLLMVRLEEVQ